MKKNYRPIERKSPISIGTKILLALVASTLTTRELVVMVFTISILFKLKVFALLSSLTMSLISLY